MDADVAKSTVGRRGPAAPTHRRRRQSWQDARAPLKKPLVQMRFGPRTFGDKGPCQ